MYLTVLLIHGQHCCLLPLPVPAASQRVFAFVGSVSTTYAANTHVYRRPDRLHLAHSLKLHPMVAVYHPRVPIGSHWLLWYAATPRIRMCWTNSRCQVVQVCLPGLHT